MDKFTCYVRCTFYSKASNFLTFIRSLIVMPAIVIPVTLGVYSLLLLPAVGLEECLYFLRPVPAQAANSYLVNVWVDGNLVNPGETIVVNKSQVEIIVNDDSYSAVGVTINGVSAPALSDNTWRMLYKMGANKEKIIVTTYRMGGTRDHFTFYLVLKSASPKLVVEVNGKQVKEGEKVDVAGAEAFISVRDLNGVAGAVKINDSWADREDDMTALWTISWPVDKPEEITVYAYDSEEEYILATSHFVLRPAGKIPELEITIDGQAVYEGDEILVGNKTLYIKMIDSTRTATAISVNGQKARLAVPEEGVWELEYNIKSSASEREEIWVEAQWQSGKQKNKSRQRFYLVTSRVPVPGMHSLIRYLPAGGKISLFNDSFIINFPKDNKLVDANGDPVATEDLEIEFATVSPPSTFAGLSPEHVHYLASPHVPLIYEIKMNKEVYLARPGTITLPYNTGISSHLSEQLAIWFSHDNDWLDGDDVILGGRADPARGIITAPFQFTGDGYYAVFLSQREFREFGRTADYPLNWAARPLTALWAKGILDINDQGPTDDERNRILTTSRGYLGLLNDDGSLKHITRLEFLSMLVKGLGLQVLPGERVYTGAAGYSSNRADIYAFEDEFYENESDESYGEENYNEQEEVPMFKDVLFSDQPWSERYFGSRYPGGSYYQPGIAPLVAAAVRHGLAHGYPGGYFKPMGYLSRQEAAVILARAADLKLADDPAKALLALKRSFADADEVGEWAAPAVLAAYQAGIVAGYPGEGGKRLLKAREPLTRVEAAALVYRLLKKLQKI